MKVSKLVEGILYVVETKSTSPSLPFSFKKKRNTFSRFSDFKRKSLFGLFLMLLCFAGIAQDRSEYEEMPNSMELSLKVPIESNLQKGVCPSIAVQVQASLTSCSGTMTDALADVLNKMEEDNLAAIQDDNTANTVSYTALPTNSNPTGCTNLVETFTATLNCFGPDGVDDGGGNDDIPLVLGTFTVTTFPSAQRPDDNIVGCTNTPTIVCSGDVLGAVAINPTGGASVANWDGTTYTSQLGESPGTIGIRVTTANGCPRVFTIPTSGCDFDCENIGNQGLSICEILANNPASPLGALDCDNVGTINSVECSDNTDPLDPCDDRGITSSMICGNLTLYGDLDCDNGGLNNAAECAMGRDPLDDSDDNCNLDIICPGNSNLLCAEVTGTAASLFFNIGGKITPNTACEPITITSDFVEPGTCGGDVLTTFTITSGDVEITCESNITVTPTVNILCDFSTSDAPIRVNCLSNIYAAIPRAVSACNVNAAVSVEVVNIVPTDPIGDNCGEVIGDYTVTFKATDECGTTSSCQNKFTVLGGTGPNITTCLPDVEVICFSEITANVDLLEYTTSCGAEAVVSTVGPTPDDLNNTCDQSSSGNVYSIQYNVTDECGRTSTCNQQFTIVNSGLTLTSFPLDKVVSCSADIVAEPSAIEALSCGSDVTVVSGYIIPNVNTNNNLCGELSGDQYSIKYTVSDQCGNTIVHTQIFTIDSPGPRILNCQSSDIIEVRCPADIESYITEYMSTIEYELSCGVEVTVVYDGPNGGGIAGNAECYNNGTFYSVQYKVTDSCGRIAYCNQSFRITDPNPIITSSPPTTIVGCSADIVAEPSAIEALSCGTDVTVVASDIIPNANNSTCGESQGDQYTIDYTVTDECGNTSTHTQTFIIASREVIITSFPPTTTVNCSADIVAQPSAIEATSCGLEVTIVASDIMPNVNNSTCGESQGDQYTIDYTVTDECGNTSIHTQIFIIADREVIITSFPPTTTVNCSADIVAQPSAIEATSCGLEVTIAASDIIPNANNSACGESQEDQYTIDYTVTDECGNTSIHTQIFIIEGYQLEITACAPDIEVTCFSEITPDISAIQTQGCEAGVTIIPLEITADPANSTCGDSAGDKYTIQYIVRDECSNANACVQTFTIVPSASSAPTISCTMGTEVACFSEIIVDINSVEYTTNCGVTGNVTRSSPVRNGTHNCPETTYTYTYTVTDECGRTASCDQVFTIENDEPTIVCQADMTVTCQAKILVGTADFNTSCQLGGSVAVTGPVVDGDISCAGTTYTYTFTGTDACGRTAECQRVFTIDNNGPTITCPPNETVSCEDEIIVGDLPVYNTDCFIGADLSRSGPTIDGIANCNGATYTYTYTVVDACGRENSCEQVFTIQNNIAPTITCPADAIVACAADIRVDATDASFTAGCDVGATIRVSAPIINGDFDCSGTTYTYTYSVEDACGRTASCDRVFTIANNELTITCPEDCPVACASDIRPGTPEFVTGCGIDGTLSVTGPVIYGDPGCDGTTYTYTHTVTDNCGRAASCDQVFTIVNECYLVDFNYDDQGNQLHPGTDMFDQYDDFTITTDNPIRCVQLFDTANPTANDFDVGTPNQQYGGPGIGAGGVNNTEFQGNALIVSKDCGVPNETEGQLIFTFDCSVTIKTVDLLDMKCGESEIELYDEHHNLIEELPIPGYGVNSFNVFDVHVSGVRTMIVDLGCGGAVTAFKYCKDNTPGSDCEAPTYVCDDYNLDFDNHGYDWATNNSIGSFDVGNQNYSITISNDDGILEDTYENEGGLLVGIDPSNVHEEVVICYNLSQITSNVSFDIFDLDYKNNQNGSRQQEAVCVYGLLGNSSTQILPSITSLDGSVDIDGNCAEATTNSATSQQDESILVKFDQCIDKVVIVYGTGSSSPTADPTYSKITIGESIGFNSQVCPGDCVDCANDGDEDGDGVCNSQDVCPNGNDFADRDGDGIPDACDDVCYDYHIDHSDCGAGWQHGDESGTVELGTESISIDMLDEDNILYNTGTRGTGLYVGIDPQTVDDELVLCYTLSESSSNVVFDIVDLDFKNPKQQEAVCIYGTLEGSPVQIMPTITSLDGSVSINGNCAEGAANSAISNHDESILVEFTECIDKITIVYGSGSSPIVDNPDFSAITIGESIFSVEQCKGGCTCPEGFDDDGDGVCNDDDVCPNAPDYMDADGDGKPDACDDDCGTSDEDGDFVCDDVDQCPGFDDNIDENNNGIPDACDAVCDESILDFAASGYNWSGHDLEDSYTVGDITFDVQITDADGILTSSHDNGSGLAVGTQPNSVNDKVVICYNLSKKVSYIKFDIVDLDYKTGGSMQQEAVCVYGGLSNLPGYTLLPTITSLDGSVAIIGNCAQATANSSISGQDESILVEFTGCMDQICIEYGTGTNSPTNDPHHGKITIGQNEGFVTEVCSDECPDTRVEDQENAHINLYPNPAYGNSPVTIEIDTEARGDAQVILTDALGRTVSNENIQLVNDLTIHQFSTDRLASGIYFVQLQTKEWRTNGLKLVVVNP